MMLQKKYDVAAKKMIKVTCKSSLFIWTTVTSFTKENHKKILHVSHNQAY
jgi:hypothetical protein